MAQLRELCEKIERKTNEIRLDATKRHWGELSRAGFIYSLATLIPELEELRDTFGKAKDAAEALEQREMPELATQLAETENLVVLLSRNREMEEARAKKAKSDGIDQIANEISAPDLYAGLEQKTLAALLKTTYLVDRMRIIDRKREPASNTKTVQRNVLELLEKREGEISDLREKYEQIRKHTFFGVMEKEGSIDLEHDLNALARKAEANALGAKKSFEAAKISFAELERRMQDLAREVDAIEELQGQEISKTFELITTLKKERDYAKKVLLEIEQETLQLRNSYSRELLSLQEEKMHYKNTIEEKHSGDVKRLKKELSERAELVKSLQNAAIGKEKKLAELEEENEKLKLVHKTVSRHGKVREQFAKLATQNNDAEESEEKEAKE